MIFLANNKILMNMKIQNYNDVKELLNILYCEMSDKGIFDKDIIIFGAGETTRLYKKCLERENLNVIAWADNDKQKQGKFLYGLPIIPPNKISKDSIVLVCSSNPQTNYEICTSLSNNNFNVMPIDQYILILHNKEVIRCIDLLHDKKSKNIYSKYIVDRMFNKKSKSFERNQYFAISDFCGENAQEVFVDLGAYVGDTIEYYLQERSGIFNKIFAFEPSLSNYYAMTKRLNRLYEEWALNYEKIIPLNAGVGKLEGSASVLKSTGLGDMLSDIGEDTVVVHSIDSYFKTQRVDFIKADIESYEYDMLHGALMTIKRDVPKMAIAIYHNPSDLFDIMLLLSGLKLGYKFSVRHHAPNYAELILYAYR